MQKYLYILVIFFLSYSNLFSQETNKREIINVGELSFSVQAPKGWIMTRKIKGYESLSCVFYEYGKELDLDSDMPIITVSVFLLANSTDNDLIWFAEVEVDMMIREEGAEVKKINKQYKNLENMYLTYNIKLPDDKYGEYYYTFVYIRYKEYGLEIVLSSPSKTEVDNLFPKLEETINSIIFKDK
jgi:hypothetical protein